MIERFFSTTSSTAARQCDSGTNYQPYTEPIKLLSGPPSWLLLCLSVSLRPRVVWVAVDMWNAGIQLFVVQWEDIAAVSVCVELCSRTWQLRRFHLQSPPFGSQTSFSLSGLLVPLFLFSNYNPSSTSHQFIVVIGDWSFLRPLSANSNQVSFFGCFFSCHPLPRLLQIVPQIKGTWRMTKPSKSILLLFICFSLPQLLLLSMILETSFMKGSA